jgi:hypothetical protein
LPSFQEYEIPERAKHIQSFEDSQQPNLCAVFLLSLKSPMAFNSARERQIKLRLERKRLACMRDDHTPYIYGEHLAVPGLERPSREITSRFPGGDTRIPLTAITGSKLWLYCFTSFPQLNVIALTPHTLSGKVIPCVGLLASEVSSFKALYHRKRAAK